MPNLASCAVPDSGPPDPAFAAWLDALRRLAEAEDIAWVVDRSGVTHRADFEAGHSPAYALITLRDMAQWRGCGCGAG